MRRAIVTMGVGPYEELLAISGPRMRAYADRHGYEYIELSGLAPERPPSWLKVLPLAAMLETYDALLWLGCDVLILDDSVDMADQIALTAWQALTAHHTGEGEIPNCDVWYLRPQMADYLRQAWAMEQYATHPWWEQKAMLDQMGYGGSPLQAEKPTELYRHTHFLPLEWNSHESSDRAQKPIFAHATYGDLQWRLDVFRRYLAAG